MKDFRAFANIKVGDFPGKQNQRLVVKATTVFFCLLMFYPPSPALLQIQRTQFAKWIRNSAFFKHPFYPSIELNCFLLLFSPLFLSHKTTTLKQIVAVKSSDLNFFFPFQFISYFYYQLLQTKPTNESSVLGGKEQLNLFPHKFHLHRYTETKTQTDCNNQL